MAQEGPRGSREASKASQEASQWTSRKNQRGQNQRCSFYVFLLSSAFAPLGPSDCQKRSKRPPRWPHERPRGLQDGPMIKGLKNNLVFDHPRFKTGTKQCQHARGERDRDPLCQQRIGTPADLPQLLARLPPLRTAEPQNSQALSCTTPDIVPDDVFGAIPETRCIILSFSGIVPFGLARMCIKSQCNRESGIIPNAFGTWYDLVLLGSESEGHQSSSERPKRPRRRPQEGSKTVQDVIQDG